MYPYMSHIEPFLGAQGWGFWAGLFGLMAVIALVALALKAFSLWYAARAGQKVWFVALFLFNTFGILEVIYLLWFRPKNPAVSESSPETADEA